MKNLLVDYSQCFKRCEGIVITSYDEYEMDSYINSYLSNLADTDIFGQIFFKKYQPNPDWRQKMSLLSEQYSKYKGTYALASKFKGKNLTFKRGSKNICPTFT